MNFEKLSDLSTIVVAICAIITTFVAYFTFIRGNRGMVSSNEKQKFSVYNRLHDPERISASEWRVRMVRDRLITPFALGSLPIATAVLFLIEGGHSVNIISLFSRGELLLIGSGVAVPGISSLLVADHVKPFVKFPMGIMGLILVIGNSFLYYVISLTSSPLNPENAAAYSLISYIACATFYFASIAITEIYIFIRK